MKKLYIGILSGSLVFITFLISQYSFAENGKKEIISIKGKIEKTHNEFIDAKISDIEKYVILNQKYIDSSQKNLDLWLKYLAFTLSILIGYSIFNGLKLREIAKEELKDIKVLKEEIKTTVKDAENRLKILTDQITSIENSANSAKKIEEKMTLQLIELSNFEEKSLTSVQNKNLDNVISKVQEELKNTGIEALKNLYLAKSIKARDEDDWEEVIRVTTFYIDLDEDNAQIFGRRAHAYQQLSRVKKEIHEKEILENKALKDYDRSIFLQIENEVAYNNKGNIHLRRGENDLAMENYNEAIKIKPEYALAYSNRSNLHKILGNSAEAEKDLEKCKELRNN